MVVSPGPCLILSHVRMFSKRTAKVRVGMGGFKKEAPATTFILAMKQGLKQEAYGISIAVQAGISRKKGALQWIRGI